MEDAAVIVEPEVAKPRTLWPLSLTYAEASPRRWSGSTSNSPATGTTTTNEEDYSGDLDVDDA